MHGIRVKYSTQQVKKKTKKKKKVKKKNVTHRVKVNNVLKGNILASGLVQVRKIEIRNRFGRNITNQQAPGISSCKAASKINIR